MKKILLSLSIFISFGMLAAQNCSELFISEYLEGYGNNRALELYNPTDQTIDLSQYSVGRFSNGSTEFTSVQIPAGYTIAPGDAFVIVIDKRDPNGTGLETPIWNGYQLWDVCMDRVTMQPIIDSLSGDTIYCVQYDDTGAPLIGTEYHDFLDLEGKGDVFLTPVYNVNNALYWNGNDAVALVKGTEISPDGSNIIDVVGVIGEDPETTIGEPAWVNSTGLWLTRNKTLVRKPSIRRGTGPVVAAFQDTFAYDQWLIYSNNTFIYLGDHNSECKTSSTSDLADDGFKVYPNPMGTNQLTIETSLEVTNIRIFNMAGRVVFEQVFFNQIGALQLDLPEIPKGMYILNLALESGQQVSRKLIK